MYPTKTLKVKNKINVFFLVQGIFLALFFLYKSFFWLLFGANIAIIIATLFLTFEIKFNKNLLKENLLYVLMLLIYFLSAVVFLAVVKNLFVQAIILGLYFYLNFIFIDNIKKIKDGKLEHAITSRNIINMICLLIIFLSVTDIINIYIFYKIPVFLYLAAAFLLTWIVTYFLFSEYGILKKGSESYIFLASLLVVQILLSGNFWLVDYPRSKTNELGIPLMAILVLIFYYSYWGIVNHKLTNTLTKKVLTEYIMISVLIVSILFLTTRWLPIGLVAQ